MIYLLALLPAILALVIITISFFKIRKLKENTKHVSRMYRPRLDEPLQQISVISIVVCIVSIIMIVALWHGEKAQLFSDTEVWNGVVTGKTREHGSYDESYDCNCRTKTRRVAYSESVGSGKNARTVTKYRTESYTECDTCHRTWYTIKWSCQTSIGNFFIDKKESLSTSVYDLPNPVAYTKIVVGEPAAKTMPYTNYLQGSEFSILQRRNSQIPADVKILPYPTSIYSFYRLDRFLTDIPEFDQNKDDWNSMVSNLNRDVGAKKQANIVVYVTKYDSNFAEMLEARWEGFNKNDVIVIIGSDQTKSIKWVRVMSWTKREDFKILTRDRVLAMGQLDMQALSAILSSEVSEKFERRHMKDFQYLEDEVHLPGHKVLLWIVLTVIGYTVGWLVVFGKSNNKFSKL